MSSRQAAVRLELALLGFFQPDGYTDKQHCDFGSYLRLRIRPAAEALIQIDPKIFRKDFNCPKGKEFI